LARIKILQFCFRKLLLQVSITLQIYSFHLQILWSLLNVCLQRKSKQHKFRFHDFGVLESFVELLLVAEKCSWNILEYAQEKYFPLLPDGNITAMDNQDEG
jgi:hypothetical protein